MKYTFSGWARDRYTARRLLETTDAPLPERYFHLIPRDGELLFLPLGDLPEGTPPSPEGVLALLREKGALRLMPMYRDRPTVFLHSRPEGFFIDDSPADDAAIRELLLRQDKPCCLRQDAPGHEVCLTVWNPHGDDPRPLEAYHVGPDCPMDPATGRYVFSGETGTVPNWESALRGALETSRQLPELELAVFTIGVEPDRYLIADVSGDADDLPAMSAETAACIDAVLRREEAQKRAARPLKKRLKEGLLRTLCSAVCERGFEIKNAKLWVRSCLKDLLFFRGTTLREKLWCYRRGFYSYHLRQYGLNEDNCRRWLSDRDYLWLRPINNEYEKWLADKVLFRYMAYPARRYLPEHYYHLVPRGGETCILRQLDCPADKGASLDDVLALLRERGALAMKKSAGLRGEGFYKLSYENGEYAVSGKRCTEAQMRKHLTRHPVSYFLTEFLTMDEGLSCIFDGAVDTIRLMVINRDGKTPRVMNAYLRISTSTSGLTDNISYGGLFCPVDLDTGHYHDAERVEDHLIAPCPVHPDTGRPIDGFIPQWDAVLTAVREMSLAIPELEYMGFDVTVTDKGVRILEINRNQSLHRCPQYGEEVQAYFREKIERKRARLGLKPITTKHQEER